MRWSTSTRLLRDERGLGTIELIVVLVLIVALAVSFWNLFGNDVSCRFADAIDAFDSAKPSAATQCRDVTTSGASSGKTARGPGSTKGRTGGRGASGKATGQGASTSASPATASPTPGVPSVPTQPGSVSSDSMHAPSSPSSAPAERSVADRIGDALAQVGEQAVDFTEGAIAGAFPLSPAIPPSQLKPTFGHEISYGVGQTLGSLGGLVYDGVQILSGGAGAISAGTLIVASDGVALPVAGPALVAATGQVAAGSAMSVGHLSNLKGGINHMMNGSEPPPRPHESGSASGSAERPSLNGEQTPATPERPSTGEKPPATSEVPPSSQTGAAPSSVSGAGSSGSGQKPSQPLKPPNGRHYGARVGQKTLNKATTTVIEPGVNVAADVEAINAGRATRAGDKWTVNGRTYGVHDGALHPVSGEGFHTLNRREFSALGVYNEFGNTPRAAEILDRMQVTLEQRARALEVFGKVHP